VANPQEPLRFDLEVPPDGRIELQLPLPAASHVTILVVEALESDADDVEAAKAALADSIDTDVLYQMFRREMGFED
jgi:hypothetical protein